MLTNAVVKAARAMPRARKMFDDRGLHLLITPAGTKSFRLKYRFGGKEKLLCLGRYPEIDLGEARERADQARAQLAAGRDPSTERGALSSGERFEAIAREWHAARSAPWSDVHARDVMTSLENHVFPALGEKPVGSIDALQLLEVIRSIEARGAHETARRVRQRLDGIFAYAIVRKHCEGNPAALIAAELAPAPMGQQKHPALLEVELLRELLAAADTVHAGALVKLASRYLALTAVRMATLLRATWCEIENLDGPAPLWRIPAAHMKLTRARKADAANDHLVPLSRQAVQLLQILRDKFGHEPRSRRLFPIAQGAIGELYHRAGYAGRHVPHGWRASFSTILNEQLPAEKPFIDQALGHVPTNKVEAAYNRAEHLARRRDLYQRWGDQLIS